MQKVKGFLKWCSLLVLAPLAFIGLYGVLSLDWAIAEIASIICGKRIKSGYEEMLDEWKVAHDD